MSWFNLTLPIDWNGLGVIATTAAVFVALAANHNSSKQLKKALQMHEQSKSIGLFDRRINVLKEVELHNKTDVLLLKVLFTENISKSYGRLEKILEKMKALKMTWSFFKRILPDQTIWEGLIMAPLKKYKKLNTKQNRIRTL